MYKAIGHCRVSKGDKEEIQNSLRSQKSEILKLATRLGLKEDEINWCIEEEARSSYSESANWSKFEKVIDEACKTPGMKYFLDFSQERFCRKRTKSQLYKAKLQRAKIKLRFVSGDVENPDSIEGYVLDSTNEMMAEFYSRKVGIDTLRGCKENAQTRDEKTGYAYKNGGSAPFWLKPKKIVIGQDKHGEDIKKTIWVENDKVHTASINGKLVSKTMWEWARYYFIELRLKQKLGVEKSRDVLNDYGVPAPRKLYWAATCLYEAEKNEALIGIGSYNKKKCSGNGGGYLKDESEWIIVKNAHPALLTEDEFEALNRLRGAKLKRAGTTSRFQSNNEHLLIGYPDRFTCGCCGSKIISSGDVYTCGKYNTNGKKGCGASYFSVSSDWLENKVLDEISKKLSDKELEKQYKDVSQYYFDDSKSKEQIKNIKKALSDKENAQANLIKSLAGMSDMNEFTVKLITKELNKTTEEIEGLKKEITKMNKPISVKIPTFETFKNHLLRAKLLLTQSNLAESRDLVWCFINSITLDPIERQVNVIFNENAFSVLMENLQKGKNIVEGAFAPSTRMVAGAGFEPTTFGL